MEQQACRCGIACSAEVFCDASGDVRRAEAELGHGLHELVSQLFLRQNDPESAAQIWASDIRGLLGPLHQGQLDCDFSVYGGRPVVLRCSRL